MSGNGFLKMIPDVVCPHCGADIIAESWEKRSVSTPDEPLREETRRFSCGHWIRYPKLWSEGEEKKQVEVVYYCPQAPGEQKRRQRRADAMEKLTKDIHAMDVDEGFKQDVLSYGIGAAKSAMNRP